MVCGIIQITMNITIDIKFQLNNNLVFEFFN